MNLWRLTALLLLLSLPVLGQPETGRTAPKGDDRLKADVLLIVAHPDDETGVSAYLAKLMDEGKRVAAVYLTHGEAGHNNMGRERGPSLGAAREMELRHALTYLGVENVWFMAGRDTPSQDVLQSLANWHHGQALEDVIRIVRITRPLVIITWLPGFFIGENHGDHQAAGVIATEAFDLAGDPSIFPAQIAQPRRVNETLLEGLQPWQAQKLYFFSDASDDKQFKGKGPSYPVTELSPKRNLLYWRIAMNEFRFHRTQYSSYIDKLEKMTDDELARIAAADKDGWAAPLQLIFGKSLVPASATSDVLAATHIIPVAYARPTPLPAEKHTGVTLAIGGPWSFYEDFRRAHNLDQLPRAEIPEIATATGATLQVPLILRNDTNQLSGVSISPALPEGWTTKGASIRCRVAPGETVPVEIDVIAPGKKTDKAAELVFTATSGGQAIGTLKMRVQVRSGGLPQ
jgi:LmbE family N-acetylglucosaminyl deacetylase